MCRCAGHLASFRGWEGTGADVDVHSSGAFLVATLRRPDREGLVARLALDGEGRPGEVVRVGSGGVVPRNAVLDGDALYVANRVSGSVQVFDAGGAAPVPAKRFDASTPFCVRLLPDP